MNNASLSFNTLGRPLITRSGNVVVFTSSIRRPFIVHRTIYNRLASGTVSVVDGIIEETVLKSGGKAFVFKERKTRSS
jgi:hypothetical protein